MKRLKSKEDLVQILYDARDENLLKDETVDILINVVGQYRKETLEHLSDDEFLYLFHLLFTQIIELQRRGVIFYFYHRKVTTPFDYYNFGLNFCRPIIDFAHSSLGDHDVIDRIICQISQGENVILFANHQAEIDPQIIDLMLQHHGYRFGSDIVFVAGERVLKDPVAIPFSLGRDIVSIYSKRYQDIDKKTKWIQQKHNRQAIQKVSKLLEEGSKIIYVAPSGGRDRKIGEQLLPAELDPKSLQLFRVVAKASSNKTHFYPLALHTYDVLPPPPEVKAELGEPRYVKFAPVHIMFGQELTNEDWPAGYVHDKITSLYKSFFN